MKESVKLRREKVESLLSVANGKTPFELVEEHLALLGRSPEPSSTDYKRAVLFVRSTQASTSA